MQYRPESAEVQQIDTYSGFVIKVKKTSVYAVIYVFNLYMSVSYSIFLINV